MTVPGKTIELLSTRLSSGETTASAVTADALDAAESLNETLNAFLQIDREGATRRAQELDKENEESRRLRSLFEEGMKELGGAHSSAAERDEPSSTGQTLRGIPVAVKDNICVRGLQATCGSRILSKYHPQYDATVIEKLKAAGAVLVGKTNCDEFAMGSSNENSAFGPARNPWDTERVPGGSSGGSAAAVAARVVPAALGSETGGSVRQPAALCGIVGVKPTYGRVSRYGLVAFGSSLDQVSVFGLTVRDAALVLHAIAGRDERDATSADVPVPDYASELSSGDVRGARIGVPRALFGEGLDPEVRSSVERAVDAYRELGAEVVDVELPHARYSIAVYYIIATAEASSNLARFDGVRYGHRTEEGNTLQKTYRRTRDEGFGAEVKRRIMLGTYVLSSGYYDAYYLKAQQVRTLIKRDFLSAFERCDAVLTPTTPTPAFRLGEKTDDPLSMYLSDIYTCMANLAGVPGVSVPCGLSSEGLPIGLQLMGRHWGEPDILRLAHAYEREHPLTERPRVMAAEGRTPLDL